MPSSSAKQHRFMAAIAHNPSFAKKVGVSQSVGKYFSAADKGKTFNKGGIMKKRRFDEGGDVSDYEIDPDSRRAHGLYDKAPKKPAAKPAAKSASVKYFEDIASGAADKRANKILSDTRDETKSSNRASYFKDRASEANQRQKKLSENLANRKTYTYKKGGMMKESKAMVGKEVAFMKKKGAPASMIKHEKAERGMKKSGMPMKDGKPIFMKKMMGGGMAKGGGVESRGKTKGTMVRMATGGSVGSASRRADGIAQRGKTRC
jgi:hypothetical protein